MSKVYWMSFADPGKPPGDRFLGVTIIEVTDDDAAAMKPELDARHPQHLPGAEWLAAASRKAHRLGCNPGGEVASYELPADWPLLAVVPRDRLLTSDELKTYGTHGRAH